MKRGRVRKLELVCTELTRTRPRKRKLLFSPLLATSEAMVNFLAKAPCAE